MKKYYKLMTMAVCLIGSLSFVSCNDDDDENEWNATYVYLERTDYLAKPKTFNLMHREGAITGDEVSSTFTVKTQKPAASDIIVDLSATFKPEDKVVLSKKQVTIKAGTTSSEEATVSVPNWDFELENLNKATYNLDVTIDSIDTGAGNTFISQNLKTLKMTINKAFVNAEFGEPAVGQLVEDRSGWTMAISEGTRGGSADRLIDGIDGTDIARENGVFWITADLGEVKTLTGVWVKCWGSSYSPTKVEISISENGKDWVSQGIVNTGGSPQSISFLQPVKTRYVKYDILDTTSSTVSIREFNVYEK